MSSWASETHLSVVGTGLLLIGNPLFQSVFCGLVSSGLYDASKTFVHRVRHDVSTSPTYYPSNTHADAALDALETITSLTTPAEALSRIGASTMAVDGMLWESARKLYFPNPSSPPTSPEDWEYVADRVFWSLTIRSVLEELQYKDIKPIHETRYIGGSTYFDLKAMCRSLQNENSIHLMCAHPRPYPPSGSLDMVLTTVQSLKSHDPTSFMWGDCIILLYMGSGSEDERRELVSKVRDVNDNLLKRVPFVLYLDTQELAAWLAVDEAVRAGLFKRRLEDFKPLRVGV